MAGPYHGYELHQRFMKELGDIWHLSQSQTYSILKRLEARGDISAELVEQDKLPDRQRLRLTRSGRRRFMDWLEHGLGSNARSIRLEFLTRLYFSNLYAPERTARIHIAQMKEVQRVIERLESMLLDLSPEDTYNRLSLDLRLRQMKLIQDWLEEIAAQYHIKTGERA